jgi:DNA-binding SARP family transcriptional activator
VSTSGPTSEFRILGPLAVVRGDHEVELGGSKQRALLAILLLRRGEVVSVDRLVDELWGEAPPPGAAKTLQVYVSRLRRALGDGLLVRRGSGYSLELGVDAVDVERFERLIDHGRELLVGGDAAGAARTLREALDLWRGPPLGDLADEPFARAEVARLEELRLAASEERIEAELALGRHDRVVAELEMLVGAHPVRERLRAQLMLALYRCGRQADALATYRDGRELLVNDFGLEPGPGLQELERAILNQDAALGAPARLPRRLPSRRPALLVALAGLVLVLAAVAAALQLVRGGGTSTALVPASDSLAVLDARRGAVVGDIPLGSGPVAVTVGDGSVWVASAGHQTLARVDPVAKQVVNRIGLGRIPSQLAFGEGALWVASAIGHRGVVLRVDPGAGAVVGSRTVRIGFGRGDDLFAPPTPSALAVGPGGIWANNLHSRLWRLAPARGRVGTVDLGASHSHRTRAPRAPTGSPSATARCGSPTRLRTPSRGSTRR